MIRHYLRAAFVLLCLGAVWAGAQEPKPVTLPKPQVQGGKPLMQALNERRSVREFSSQSLEPQILSNLLWAACGVNRPDGRRTAPSGMNRQEIDVYAITPEGAYRYEPKLHALTPVAGGNLMSLAGTQPYVKDAALNLLLVADRAKMATTPEEDWLTFSGADAGFVSQNVYLFCASEGLGTVVRASIDRPALAKALGLRPDQRIVLAQTVGYQRK